MDIARSVRELFGRKRLFFINEKRSGRLAICNNTSFRIDLDESQEEAIYYNPFNEKYKVHVHAYSKKNAIELAAEMIAIAKYEGRLNNPKKKPAPPSLPAPIERKENKIRQLVTHA